MTVTVKGLRQSRRLPAHLVAEARGPPQRQDSHQHLQERLASPAAVLPARGHHGLHALQQALAIQVLQREDPGRPQSAFPLQPCVPAPREKRPGSGVHHTEEEPEGLGSKASCPTSHMEFMSDQGF